MTTRTVQLLTYDSVVAVDRVEVGVDAARFPPTTRGRGRDARHVFVVLLICSACWTGGASEGADELVQTMTHAARLYHNGQAAEAVGALLPAYQAKKHLSLPASQRLDFLTLLTFALEAYGDPETALEVGRRPYEKRRTQALAMVLSRCALAVQRPDLAQAWLERIPASSRDRDWQHSWSIVLYSESRLREAEKQFRKILAGGPSRDAAHYLGILLYERNDFPAAVEQFSAALDVDPNDYYSLIYKAHALLALNRLDEAANLLSGRKRRFESKEIYYLLGKVRFRQKRFDEAAEHLRKAVKNNDGYEEALFLLFTTLQRLGQREKATAAMKKFSAARRESARRRRQLDALGQKGLRDPKNVDLLAEVAAGHYTGSNWEQAERLAWRALRQRPNHIPSRLVLARVFRDTGRFSAAAIHYQKILRQEPQHTAAARELRELIRMHSRRGNELQQ